MTLVSDSFEIELKIGVTSKPPTNGIMVSFNSGLSGPISVQNLVSPSLMALFCASEVVTLNKMARALPS